MKLSKKRKIRLFKSFERKAPAEIALHIIVSAFFMILALSYLYLIFWALMSGAKTHMEVVMNPFGLPEKWHWEHYLEVLKELEVGGNNFWDMLFNSVYFTVVPATIQIFTTCTFAYCCTKYSFPGSTLPYTIILIMMTLPLYGTAGATYELYHKMGLISSYWQPITAAAGMSVNFLYFRAFIQNMSWTYAEAAQMDGANDFQIYFRIYLPQLMPICGALFLTTWLAGWNSYESPMIYLRDLPTLPVGIYQFNQEMIYAARLDILFAACVIVSLPALILFAVFNKTITTNVSLGGIKG